MNRILAALLLCSMTACAVHHEPKVDVQPIIVANKKTKKAIKKTEEHQKQLTESQVKVEGSLKTIMDDLNLLLKGGQ